MSDTVNILERGQFRPTPLDDKFNLMLQEGLAWLYSNNPFWAALLTSPNLTIGFVPPALESVMRTAATDGFTQIWLNRKFFENDVFPKARAHSVSEVGSLLYIVLHEMAHILADHSNEGTLVQMPDPQIKPLAVDYQVYDLLAKDKFLAPACFDLCPVNDVHSKSRKPDPKKIGCFGDLSLTQYVPNGDSVVEIYNYLAKNQPQGGKGQSNELSDDVKPEYADGSNAALPGDDGDEPSSAGALGGSPVDSTEAKQNQREQMIANAVIASKTIGNMSAAAERFGNALTKSKTPWARQLANLMSNAVFRSVERKRSYRRIGRRTDASAKDYAVKPGRIKDPKPGVLLVNDCSGSISDDEMNKFAAECEAVLRSGKVGYIRVVYCDTQVHDKGEVFRPRDKVRLKAPSTGGTDFEPVWHWQRKHAPDVAAIIYLTDLYGSFGPKKSWPKVPVIWGATTEVHPPFGTAVRIKQ